MPGDWLKTRMTIIACIPVKFIRTGMELGSRTAKRYVSLRSWGGETEPCVDSFTVFRGGQ